MNPRGFSKIVADRTSACVLACDGIPTQSLKEGAIPMLLELLKLTDTNAAEGADTLIDCLLLCRTFLERHGYHVPQKENT